MMVWEVPGRKRRKSRFWNDVAGFEEHKFGALTLQNEHLALARCRFTKKHNFPVRRFSKMNLLK